MSRLYIILTVSLYFISYLFTEKVCAQEKVHLIDPSQVSIDSCLLWMKDNTANIDTYHDVGLQTLDRAIKNKVSDRIIAEIHEELANWHSYNGVYPADSVVYHSEQALIYYQKTEDYKKIADTYRALSIDYMNTRQLDKAEVVLFKSIKLYEDLNDEAGLGSAYRSLGVLYQVLEDFQESVDYTLKATPLLEKTESYSALAIAQFNLIIGYGQLEEFEKAYKAAEYGLEIVNNKVPEEVFIPVRIYSYRGEVYLKAEDYDNALKDYIKAWELCKEKVGEDRCATYRTEVGQVYLFKKDYRRALDHLLIGVQAYEEKGQNNIIQPYLDLAECYIQLGDFKNALFYKDKATANSKKILEDKVAHLESEMVIKYETGKKDEALAMQANLIEQKNKTQALVIAVASLLFVFLVSLLYFFNKNKQKTSIIRAKNDENELLLKEIHHRVKNNLQTISSLLSLQSESIKDKSAWDAVQESKNRVNSMALLHQKLYQGKNLAAIEMRDYFETIGKTIIASFGEKAENISLAIDMSEIELDVDTAVPIGLITNELVTNSLKHAFSNQNKGNISINLTTDEDGMLQLKIADDGQFSIPKNSEDNEGGFGSLLVKLLTTQLGGLMEKTTTGGTSILLKFPRQEKSAA